MSESSSQTAEATEQQFRNGEYGAAAASYLALQNTEYHPLSELRLALIDLIQGRTQPGLDRAAQLTESLANQQAGHPDPQQWATVILSLLANRLVEPAVEAAQKFPQISSYHLNRAKWVLGAVVGWEPGKSISRSQLEPQAYETPESIPGITGLSIDQFVSLMCHIFVGSGLANEGNALVNVALQQESKLLYPTVDPQLERLGSEYGGWIIPEGTLSSTSICYCPGVGEDISFDEALLNKYGCHVFAFDPTPRSKAFVEQSSVNTELFHFYDYGLWNEDTELTFFAPADPTHVSHSVGDLQTTSKAGFQAKVRKLSSLMKELGHERIDLLKMDIEGAEYPVVENILEEKVPISALCIEYHNLPDEPDARFRSIKGLLSGGYTLVSIEHDNYSFVRNL